MCDELGAGLRMDAHDRAVLEIECDQFESGWTPLRTEKYWLPGRQSLAAPDHTEGYRA
jgi:hypothetical protein